MTVRDAIRLVTERIDLSPCQAADAARDIMRGQASSVQIAGLLTALRTKGESVDEIVGFAQAMREQARAVPLEPADLVDACGTGGDALGTFNISTVSAFVAAGAGCRVAKHGNRWISGKCGSADVLEALGVQVEISAEHAARCIRDLGIGFLFAPLYHAGTAHAAEARRGIGIRSLFNVLGPLANPAGAPRQMIGVFERPLVRKVAESLRRLGAARGLVVHGADGLDEITTAERTHVCELQDGALREYEVSPEQLGVGRWPLSALRGGDATTNAEIARRVLQGAPGGPRDVVLLNAAGVIYAAQRAETLAAGVRLAREAIDSGAALHKLDALREMTQAGAAPGGQQP